MKGLSLTRRKSLRADIDVITYLPCMCVRTFDNKESSGGSLSFTVLCVTLVASFVRQIHIENIQIHHTVGLVIAGEKIKIYEIKYYS